MATIVQLPTLAQPRGQQDIAAKPKRRYPKRMPSSLTKMQQSLAVQTVRHTKRSVHEVAHEYSVANVVVLELWLRNLERRLAILEAELMRGVA